MLDFLPEKYLSALSFINIENLCELRLRAGKPVVINYKGRYSYLCERGINGSVNGSLYADYNELEEIVFRASEYSMYSVTEQLKQGFLTGNKGERIGIVGSFVYENGKVFTVKEITSLNIRVPHEILGCSDGIYDICLKGGLKNVLVLSAPGRGKTTILRDLARRICDNNIINVLINDERNEIAAAYKNFTLNIGAYCDVIRYTYKKDAFSSAVRAMRPDVIITDELASTEDVQAVCDCIRSGVNVIASVHMKDIEYFKNSDIFAPLIYERMFDYYALLDFNEIGKLYAVYDNDLKLYSKIN